MNKRGLSVWAVVTLLIFSFGCNSDDNGLSGDEDNQEVSVDGDLEAEVDETVTDGDQDEETDGDFDFDMEAEYQEDSETESGEFEDELEAEVEAETEIEEEQEIVEYPQTRYEELPTDFVDVTVTPCVVEDEKTSSYVYQPETGSTVWGDDEGLVYFALRNYKQIDVEDAKNKTVANYENDKNVFWVFDEINKTFTCDPAIENIVFAMDGINTDDGPVIWIAEKNRIGKRATSGDWSFFDIPDVESLVMPDDHYMAAGIEIGDNGWIAVWGKWGIGFYNETTETWKRFDFPAFAIEPLILNGSWHGDKFYMPLGCKIYSYTMDQNTATEEVAITGCDASNNDGLYVVNKNDNELELAQVFWKKDLSKYGAVNQAIKYNISNGMQKVTSPANIWDCKNRQCGQTGQIMNYNYYYAQFIHLLPSMGGEPYITLLSGIGGALQFAVLGAYVKLGPVIDDEDGLCRCTLETCMSYSWVYNGSAIGEIGGGWQYSYFDYYIRQILSQGIWRNGITMWIGTTRVTQDVENQ